MNKIAIIPAFNEKEKIAVVLNKIIDFVDLVIVVDDGSTDGTNIIAKNINKKVIVLKHELNLGKGAALKTGCEAALKLNADVIICLDADDQHKPEDIPRFIEKIRVGNDIVFGSRLIGKGMPLTRFLGNKFLSAVICQLFKIYINDTQSGFKAFTAEAYKQLKWQSPDYAVETEIIVKTAEKKLKFEEISINTIYHDNYKGVTPITGLQIFFQILKWKFL
jgi:glycosyltransferase involved in cell wall biosynthesis